MRQKPRRGNLFIVPVPTTVPNPVRGDLPRASIERPNIFLIMLDLVAFEKADVFVPAEGMFGNGPTSGSAQCGEEIPQFFVHFLGCSGSSGDLGPNQLAVALPQPMHRHLQVALGYTEIGGNGSVPSLVFTHQ